MWQESDTRSSRSSPDATPATASGSALSIIVIGDLCLDLNEEGGRIIEAGWGSPALFIARQLESAYGLTALVSGSYGEDLRGLVGDFRLDREPAGLRSLSYRNVIGPTIRDDASAEAHSRVQYWRASDREPRPINARVLDQPHDLVYFCPLVPDLDRADDIELITNAGRSAGEVRVLIAQGLMRTSGAPGDRSYLPVRRREISDDEAATWSCFDIVVFSDEDQPAAVEKAARWSSASPDTGFVVTRGHLGATLCSAGTATPISTRPLTEPATTVGAGDVFGAVIGLEFHRAQVQVGMTRSAAMHRAAAMATAAASAYVRSGDPAAAHGSRPGASPLSAMMAE